MNQTNLEMDCLAIKEYGQDLKEILREVKGHFKIENITEEEAKIIKNIFENGHFANLIRFYKMPELVVHNFYGENGTLRMFKNFSVYYDFRNNDSFCPFSIQIPQIPYFQNPEEYRGFQVCEWDGARLKPSKLKGIIYDKFEKETYLYSYEQTIYKCKVVVEDIINNEKVEKKIIINDKLINRSQHKFPEILLRHGF